MKLLLQRVKQAAVKVDGTLVGQIGQGLLLFFGVAPDDTAEQLVKLADKVINLRLFADKQGKMNLDVRQVGGSLLLVSQFTLYADCRRGRRPDFTGAAAGPLANGLYEEFTRLLKATGVPVQTGIFGADMQVELVNDGPVTIMLEA